MIFITGPLFSGKSGYARTLCREEELCLNAQDLADALNRGVIAGAGIDVFDREPPLDSSEPLLHAKNTILTPHVAFASAQSMTLRANIVFENLAAWLAGRQQNVVL